MKKIESVILSMVMIISLIAVAPESTEAAVIGKVTVSIEKLTKMCIRDRCYLQSGWNR